MKSLWHKIIEALHLIVFEPINWFLVPISPTFNAHKKAHKITSLNSRLHCYLCVWQNALFRRVLDETAIKPCHWGIDKHIGQEKAPPIAEISAYTLFVEHC